MKMFKRLASLALAIAISLGMVCNAGIGVDAAESSDTSSWMSGISDDTLISLISIPGSHDSASQYVALSPIFRCQNTSILEQVENGCRYLDIRLALVGDESAPELGLCHNFVNCKTKGGFGKEDLLFESVVDDMYDFLEENPSETLIMNMKVERSDDDVATVEKLLYDIIDANPDKWYTQNSIPTLGDVRGKIILATRFDDVTGLDESKTGLHLNWEDQKNTEVADIPYVVSDINSSEQLAVQDRYKYVVDDKFEAFKETAENCKPTENTMVINFTSTAGKNYAGFPKKYAKKINARLLDYEFSGKTSYGVIVMDYFTPELAQHVYMSNF